MSIEGLSLTEQREILNKMPADELADLLVEVVTERWRNRRDPLHVLRRLHSVIHEVVKRLNACTH